MVGRVLGEEISHNHSLEVISGLLSQCWLQEILQNLWRNNGRGAALS